MQPKKTLKVVPSQTLRRCVVATLGMIIASTQLLAQQVTSKGAEHTYLANEDEKQTICRGAGNFWLCEKRIEATALKQSPKQVSRTGNILRLVLSNGKTLEYKDEPLAPGSNQIIPVPSYYYLGSIGSVPYYVISYAEESHGGGVLLINGSNGNTVGMRSAPVPTKSGTYVAEGFFSDGSYEEPSGGLKIWKLNPYSAQLVYERNLLHNPREQGRPWGAEKLKWIESNVLEFSKGFEQGRIRLVEGNEGWKFEEPIKK